MVDNFIDSVYVRMMINTSQEETLAGKSAFERWASTFGVKIKIYHEDYGRLSEQHFRSEIEDANHNITFFLVGYHHRNAIVERNTQNLTPGSGSLILCAKLYWSEAITTLTWTYSLKAF